MSLDRWPASQPSRQPNNSPAKGLTLHADELFARSLRFLRVPVGPQAPLHVRLRVFAEGRCVRTVGVVGGGHGFGGMGGPGWM